MLCKIWWRNGHVFSKRVVCWVVCCVWKTPSEATRSIQGKVKGITTNTLEAAYYAVHSISYSSDSSTRPSTMTRWEAKCCFQPLWPLFLNLFNVPFCPWQTCSAQMIPSNLNVMRSRQKLRTFSSLPIPNGPTGPTCQELIRLTCLGRRPLASLKPPYRLPVQGRLDEGSHLYKGACTTLSWPYNCQLKADYMTLQMPTYATFLFNTMISFPMPTSVKVWTSSAHPPIRVWIVDGQIAIRPCKKNTGCLTLWHFCFILFLKKKSPKLWFWIIFFFCEKNKSWEFGIISRGFLTKTIPGPWLNIIDWGVPLSRLIKSTRSSTQISCLHQRTQNGGCNFFFKQKGFRKQFQKKWANHPSNQNNNDSLTHFPKVLRIKPYIKKSCPWSMTNNGIHAKATCFPNVEPKISFYTGSTCPRLRGNGPWQKSLQKLVSCVLLSVMKVLRLWLLERWWWCLCTLRRAFRGIWHLSWHCLKASNQSISD